MDKDTAQGQMDLSYLALDLGTGTLSCLKAWSLKSLESIEQEFHQIQSYFSEIKQINMQGLEGLDSAAACVLSRYVEQIKAKQADVIISGWNKKYEALYQALEGVKGRTLKSGKDSEGVFYRIGAASVSKYQHFLLYFAFFGEILTVFWGMVKQPKRFKWPEVGSAVYQTGFEAFGIVALMNFLIGVVLTYQLGQQLKYYGANIYIVDLTGVAILREFAPLITAVILAGRTSTSFAALIGSMKVNQEVSALITMGVTPFERLVVPRAMGLVIALPLLIVVADIFGMLGSMVMAAPLLGVGPYSYFERLPSSVGYMSYFLGVIKAPFFALIIACVGCFQGLSVRYSAYSVGEKTTHAAVQSIFLIIIADALFSILYSIIGV